MIGLGSDTNTVETLQCDVLPTVQRRQALSRLVMDDSDALESPFKTPPSLFMCATQQLLWKLWIRLWPFCPFRPFFQSQSWPLLLSATCIVGSFCHDLERCVWKQKLRTHSRGLALPFHQLNELPKTNNVSDQVSNGQNWKSCIYLIVESSIENQVLRMPSDKLALHRRLLIPTEPSYLSKQRRTN